MPNSSCDLHLHTYYSDGHASPADLLHYAASIGLKTLSITDHDNLNAVQEATNIARELGLEYIPGIELTSHWESCIPSIQSGSLGQDVDVLGYYVNPHDSAFQAFIQSAFADMRERITDCCSQLSKMGYPVTIYHVLDENPRYPGAMQLISALWHAGYADSWNDAYPLFAMAWTSVRPCNFSIDQVISAIHDAGGAAVLAHPIAIKCENGWLQAEQIEQLAALGIDGLEINHPRMDTPARAHFSSLAQKYNLLVTGGSDEHGWNGSFMRIGSELITYEMVNALRKRARAYASP